MLEIDYDRAAPYEAWKQCVGEKGEPVEIRFDRERLVVEFQMRGNWIYEIDLDAHCETSAQILDWIAQVSGKTWANDMLIGRLVRTLDALFYLQSQVCPHGMEKRHAT